MKRRLKIPKYVGHQVGRTQWLVDCRDKERVKKSQRGWLRFLAEKKKNGATNRDQK